MAMPPRTLGRPLADVMSSTDTLASLLERVHQSRSWLGAVVHLLPEGLRNGVRAGPLDDKHWVLLVSNSASAAKVRQLLPALEADLVKQGLGGVPIRIKVLPRA